MLKLILLVFCTLIHAGVVVNHTYDLESIPGEVLIELTTKTTAIHFANRSDGSSITWGLRKLAEGNPSVFPYQSGYTKLPNPSAGLNFWQGMENTDYVPPEGYWSSEMGTDELGEILRLNPSIKYTTWTWCDEHTQWNMQQLSEYLQAMDSLEKEFPNVTFIYQTGARRSYGTAEADFNGWVFNDSLRKWVIAHDKVLFDFGDLDEWHNDLLHLSTLTLAQGDTTIPMQHPAWDENNGPTTGWHHANDAMAFDKAKAWWYLMAVLEMQNHEPSTLTNPAIKRATIPYQPKYNGAHFNLLGQTISSERKGL